LKKWRESLTVWFGDFEAALNPPPAADPDDMPF
jgi:hypothetical protein